MSSRRGPLTNNPNVANSPMRGLSSALQSKQKPSQASIQREESYGQPPSKKQALESTVSRPSGPRSPSKIPRTQTLAQRGVSTTASSTTRTAAVRDRASRSAAAGTTSRQSTQQEDSHKEAWKKHYRAKFPTMVFYFESIPDDIRAKLTKRVSYLGARQEPFFSIDVTHVITARSIPTDRAEPETEPENEEPEAEEQPQTINPSLLDRNTAARRKLLFEFRAPSRPQNTNDPAKPSKLPRNNDVLFKARDMGKKIWPLDKFQTMVSVLLETETQTGTTSSRAASRTQGLLRAGQEKSLHQLLQHERINGPTDRDASAASRDLTYFKGPHVYVFDMDERHKPMMVREYARVANKADGDWPQFRSVGNGRCPFVEEDPQDREYRKQREQRELRHQREQEKARLAAAAAATAAKKDSVSQAAAEQAKPVTGKRSLSEMEDGHNRTRVPTAPSLLNPAKAALSKQTTQNAFTSRAEGGRVFHGEPVASGLQPSNVTSAIRSQMISSQAGVSAIKTGTSKELHGLQRKVLEKAAPASHETSSRRPVDHSCEGASNRSAMSRPTSRPPHGQDDGSVRTVDSNDKRTQSQPLKSKKDMKPGYCENCQDKFRDFDEHIVSRKHRRFAENQDNWAELDALLAELKRMPKDYYMDDEYGL
ncbi:regulatory subunit for Cdc7p protein kinase [Geosmithia morbida]|uniref:Regulatory subunit for Cdc7p protein kinase n=1 Tax=Geosmithia morbida TaxID=1094350 RepID=A0A9P5D355_9HYPO|nr:regulatory subunit for Cdc7p protein kinase [Geosmithia morbida]KAF4122191.1 regulatory subunit for Cdc7p protein kinase [Geosmithia morbida]